MRPGGVHGGVGRTFVLFGSTSSPTNAKDQSIALAAILLTMVPPSRKIHWPAELPQKSLRFSDSSFSQLTALSPSSYIITR